MVESTGPVDLRVSLRRLAGPSSGARLGGVPQNSYPPRWVGALTGLAAAAAALAVAELIAVGTGAGSAPLVVVGGVVVDHVPGGVKQFAISVFGTHDKTALLLGTTALLGAFAAGIGVAALRRRWIGYAGIGLFGLVGMIAAATRTGAGPLALLPSVLGAGTGVLVLDRLLNLPGVAPAGPARTEPTPGPARTEPTPGPARTEPTPGPAAEPAEPVRPGLGIGDRRRFLRWAGGTTVGAALLGLGGQQLVQRKDVSAARSQVTLPTPGSPAPATLAQTDLGVPDLAPFVTPNRDFYRIDTALAVPQVDPNTWTLRIHGRVARPATYTYQQLLAMPTIERYVTLACVSNEVGGDLIGNARWQGVPVKGLIEAAGPLPGADQVVGRSVDGFTVGTPTEVLLDGRDAMLAIGMNGEPLPIEHGFPVRMVVPGLYGYVSATKWISELELTSFTDYSAYWIPRGWAARAPIKTESRIDTPKVGATPRAGPVIVAGVAWAQHRGIAKVEVRVDDGPWRNATLGAVPSVDTWRQWQWQWDATPGRHTIAVRATDNGGQIQTQQRAAPAPDGASGWHSIEVTVR